MINSYCKESKFEHVLNLWDDMKSCGLMPNYITCNILIRGICKAGEIDKDLNVLNAMRILGFSPTTAIPRFMLDASSRNERADDILLMHEHLVSVGLELKQAVFNTLITVLCRLGRTHKVVSVLEDMTGRCISADTETYNALIHGYCTDNHVKKSFAIFSVMLLREDFHKYCHLF
ncbi:hypothetical protein V6N13_026146 [Hibiscus sabdariffa]|uniref:Pentatricopeptide repeat-containing protein n=1 Tax=Hibiscus sabdariffa TaxID=183260 RepID=A0ABR2P5E2_9ROSI